MDASCRSHSLQVKRIKHTWGARDVSSHLEAPFVFFFGAVGEGVVGMVAARRRRTHSLHVIPFRLLDMVEVYENDNEKKNIPGARDATHLKPLLRCLRCFRSHSTRHWVGCVEVAWHIGVRKWPF